MSRLLTINEAAEFLRVSRTTLYNLMARGLPYVPVCGRGLQRSKRRFRQEDLDRWVQEQLIQVSRPVSVATKFPNFQNAR